MLDPETRADYEYSVIVPSVKKGAVRQGEIQLCANFALDSVSGAKDAPAYAYPNDKWSQHTVGRSCDVETVTLEGYATVPEAPFPPQGTPPQPVFIKQ